MKNLKLLTLLTIFLVLQNSGCKEGCRNITAKNYCGSCDKDCKGCCDITSSVISTNKGGVVFWTNSSSYVYTTITLSNGSSNAITNAYTSGTPACLAANGAYFYLDAGDYSFTATKAGSVIKSGSVHINGSTCNRFLIP